MKLLQDLIGCTAQCPFCGEQCDLLQPGHITNGQKHYTAVHRIECIGGLFHESTNVLMSGICTSTVDSDSLFFLYE